MMRIRYSLLSIFLLNLVCLSLPQSVLAAANMQLGPVQDQLSGTDDPYTVPIVLTINVANGTEYYLRGVFFKDGTTNYCGYTFNGTDWINSPGEYQKFLKISITDDKWEGELKAKIDQTDPGCKESGLYRFKVYRYTMGGSSNTDAQNELTVAVVLPTLTPTNSPPTDTPVPPTNTPKPPTSTPTTKLTPTPKPSATLTPTPTRKEAVYPTTKSNIGKLSTATISVFPTAVLGASTKTDVTTSRITPFPTKSLDAKTLGSSQSPLQNAFLVGMGILAVITIGLGGYIYKQSKDNL